MKADPKLVQRLSRIQGQVGGVARMVEEGRYCIDVLTQLQAVKAALRKAEEEILKNHSDGCIAHAIRTGNKKEARKKFAELVELFGKTSR